MPMVKCAECGDKVPLRETKQRWRYEGDKVTFGDLFAINEKPKVRLKKIRVCKGCQ